MAQSGCTECAKGKSQFRECDVHALVNNDHRTRLTRYCGVCEAWICDECRGRYGKRAVAMMLRALK